MCEVPWYLFIAIVEDCVTIKTRIVKCILYKLDAIISAERV